MPLSFRLRPATLYKSSLKPNWARAAVVWGEPGFRGQYPEFGTDAMMATRAKIPGIGDTNMTARSSAARNDYRCTIDRNQSGKYCVRIQVHYPRHAWTLGIFFLAS